MYEKQSWVEMSLFFLKFLKFWTWLDSFVNSIPEGHFKIISLHFVCHPTDWIHHTLMIPSRKNIRCSFQIKNNGKSVWFQFKFCNRLIHQGLVSRGGDQLKWFIPFTDLTNIFKAEIFAILGAYPITISEQKVCHI